MVGTQRLTGLYKLMGFFGVYYINLTKLENGIVKVVVTAKLAF